MLLVLATVKPSQIHGLGLFAEAFIQRGARIWEVTPGYDITIGDAALMCLPAVQRDQLRGHSFKDMHTGEWILCADNDRYTNHADDPNTREIHEAGTLGYSIAIRDIQPGEEITCDYRTFDADWRRKLGRSS